MNTNEGSLSYLNDEDRLKIYTTILTGCQHIYSKNKLQKEKLDSVLETLVSLVEKDPYFLAHFTSYAVTKMESKDLKVVSTFVNSLNDADGTPFSAGSKYKKPNLRTVSQAAIQHLDPKLVARVIEIANMKQTLGNRGEGTHFSRSLKTAVRKYLKYREQNPKALEGIRKVGFGKIYRNLYRVLHLSPSNEAASILNWRQKDGRDIAMKKNVFDFKDMTDIQIAEKIRTDKLPPTGVLGALEKKISPVIAAAILEQCSGDQAVIYREMFDSQGLLKNKEVMKVFTDKIKTAKTALDRVERINTEIDEEVSKALKSAKSEVRKEQVGDIGRVFLHIDVSGSMNQAISFAKDHGATIAECVQNPEENFFWGLFNVSGKILKKPKTFEKDAFVSSLYGIRADGGTNCLACYEYAREHGCDVDIYVTDQGHNNGDIQAIVKKCEQKGYPKPKAAVIVSIGLRGKGFLARQLEAAGIPVSIIYPEALTESALVSQSVREALKGPMVVIEEIMNTKLLKLPQWWESV